MGWKPSLGAWIDEGTVRFCVWAPHADTVEVVFPEGRGPGSPILLERSADGTHQGEGPECRAGDWYGYRLDGRGPFPDPASRFQPSGVHGASQIIDAHDFRWSDASWTGIPRDDLVIYELHIGTFSPEGTFAGASEKLPDLARLGIDAVELMPVADFPGRRNWGYDGVALFAPARCYGEPDDLRALVDRAHALGIAVLLDVVYNHFGPDGSYLASYSPLCFSDRHRTPWGPAVNLDGPGSPMVRAFFIENALHWIHEYHLDGLRLDATHAMIDEGPRHFLAELSATVRDHVTDREVHLIAEDHRNLAGLLRPESAGGWGLVGVWSDDFHHELRRLLAGDEDGVYRDFSGSVADLVTILNRGWLFTGAYSIHRGRPRGTEPDGLPLRRFVFCIQNHDRIGNRARGERLHHQIDAAAYRAASSLLILAPETPLLFMGQEWAASSPFLFFTDHHDELGRRVREGRLREFRSYRAFQDPAALELIADPQDEATFLASRLNWPEREREPHSAMLRLYRDLLALRRGEPAFAAPDDRSFKALALGEDALALVHARESDRVVMVGRLRGSGTVTLGLEGVESGVAWEIVLDTEDARYAPAPEAPAVQSHEDGLTISFRRPGAVVVRSPARR